MSEWSAAVGILEAEGTLETPVKKIDYLWCFLVPSQGSHFLCLFLCHICDIFLPHLRDSEHDCKKNRLSTYLWCNFFNEISAEIVISKTISWYESISGGSVRMCTHVSSICRRRGSQEVGTFDLLPSFTLLGIRPFLSFHLILSIFTWLQFYSSEEI